MGMSISLFGIFQNTIDVQMLAPNLGRPKSWNHSDLPCSSPDSYGQLWTGLRTTAIGQKHPVSSKESTSFLTLMKFD